MYKFTLMLFMFNNLILYLLNLAGSNVDAAICKTLDVWVNHAQQWTVLYIMMMMLTVIPGVVLHPFLTHFQVIHACTCSLASQYFMFVDPANVLWLILISTNTTNIYLWLCNNEKHTVTVSVTFFEFQFKQIQPVSCLIFYSKGCFIE